MAEHKAAAKPKAPKVEAPVIDVQKFIYENTTPYTGDASFLAPATDRTKAIWKKCEELLNKEREKGVLDIDCKTPSSVTSHGPGYIDKEKDVIVGLQTDAPLKRAIKPKGGWRVVEGALQGYGYKLDESVKEIFPKYRKTHNDGVFDVYSPEMLLCRKYHLLTGLPDAYGRGRIIGDYRRIALYGIDGLIAAKKKDHAALGPVFDDETIRLKEEVAEQVKALNEIKQMAASYGYDISKPATSAKEAIQWVYFGFLASVKEQDGAAMSMGRIDAFLDIFIEKDLKAGKITESQAQEMIDDFVVKLRLVRHVRAPAFNALFAGDPTWVTVSIGGVLDHGKSGVNKTSFRIVRTLENLGAAPEPNITVLWENSLPQGFKEYVSKVSIDTSSLQFENDKMMRDHFGCDYSVACCVSGQKTGKEMQFFGARCNFPKLLLYCINEGRDEMEGQQVAPKFKKLSDGPLKFEEVMHNFEEAMHWMAGVYINTLNIIHYMHDKYCYEAAQMSLIDTDVKRMLALGVSGLSVLIDSLSAIKFAKVTAIRNEKGIATDFKIEGDFPKYGNDDNAVDQIGPNILNFFSHEIHKHKTYRNAETTLSVLTITSNVVYGEATGTTPDGRKKGQPFAPGANPMNARDTSGALASLNSVAKLPYDQCLDGISNTFSIVPTALGKDEKTRVANLCALLTGYLGSQGHHLNVNVMYPDTLRDAMEHPEKYPSLTIRVSGYAVNFVRLTRAQQLDVISRTFHQDL